MRVYYHTFFNEDEHPAYTNLRVPTLLSIATLRAVNKDIEIVVLNGSENLLNNTWGKYKEELDFKVWHIDMHLAKNWGHIEGWKHLSRLFDLRRHAEEVIYCDSDVFWLKDPLPLECDQSKFCFDGWNTGFFYYGKSEHINRFFELFEAYTMASMANPDIRQIVKKEVGYEAWYDVWDEMILTHMTSRHSDLFELIPISEHCTMQKMEDPEWKLIPEEVKMFHANGVMVNNFFPQRKGEEKHSRGLLCLIIKEFYDNLCKVLDPADIFDNEAIEFYLENQTSLFDSQLTKSLKSRDGHYQIKNMINPPIFF